MFFSIVFYWDMYDTVVYFISVTYKDIYTTVFFADNLYHIPLWSKETIISLLSMGILLTLLSVEKFIPLMSIETLRSIKIWYKIWEIYIIVVYVDILHQCVFGDTWKTETEVWTVTELYSKPNSLKFSDFEISFLLSRVK